MTQDMLPRIALDALMTDPCRAIGPTVWHDVPQVVTRNGVAVAVLVPLDALRHLPAARHDKATGTD